MTEKPRTILVVAGDPILLRILEDGFPGDCDPRIINAATAEDALAMLEEDAIDLVLLSDDPTDGRAIDLWSTIRRRRHGVPVVYMITDPDPPSAPEEEAEDTWDTVVCPVRLSTLVSVLKASIVRDGSGSRPLTIGRYRLDGDAKTIEDSETGVSVRLTEKETAILRFLHERGSAPVSRETLLGDVWGYNDKVTTHTLETHIYRLRRKLEGLGADGASLVHTGTGGYCLNPGEPSVAADQTP